MTMKWLIALAVAGCLSTIKAGESHSSLRNKERFSNLHENLDIIEKDNVAVRSKRAVPSCRWSPTSHILDCKLMDIEAMGGLVTIARRTAKTLDLSFCKIEDTEKLLAGLKAMPYLNQVILDNNAIRNITKRLFWNNRRLRIISIQGTQISVLHDETFWRSPNLNILKLSENKIASLPPRIFYRNKRLKELELWGNKIKTLPPMIFWRNPYLEYINLSWNKIKNLPPALFQRNRLLKTLKLFRNKLWCVSSHQFEDNYELREINLGNNKLDSLPMSTFWHNTKLEDLRMSANEMHCLPSRLLDFNKKLGYVNMIYPRPQSLQNLRMSLRQSSFRGKDIQKLKMALDDTSEEWCDDSRKYEQCEWNAEMRCFNCESALLSSSSSLDTVPIPCDVLHLNLANNRLNDTRKLESLLPLFPDLITVILSENNFKTTQGELFYQLKRLEKVDLSSNDIKVLPWKLFRRSRRLQEIDLSKNVLTEIHHDALAFTRALRVINLGYNHCEDFAPGFFAKNQLLREIYLNNNKIINLQENMFKENVNLLKLDVSCNQIEYISPLLLDATVQLQEINLKENRLIELEEGLFRNLMHLRNVDLSENHIEHIPEGFFKENENLRRVYLNGNQLLKLGHDMFNGNPVLNFLSLDENRLSDVPEDMFRTNKHLKALGLQHNCISYLSENIFENNPRLREVSLRGNPTLPRELRRVFEGVEEVRELRKHLRQINEELEPTETTRTIIPAQTSATMDHDNRENGRKRENGSTRSPEEEDFRGFPIERLRDDPNQIGEQLSPVGAELIDILMPLSPRDGPDDTEVESRSKRSTFVTFRKHERRKRDTIPWELERLTETVDEEGVNEACLRVWKKSGLL